MLIGQTLTLAEFEEVLTVKSAGIRKEIADLDKKRGEYAAQFKTIPKLVQGQHGKEIVNPEYKRLPKLMLEAETKTDDLLNLDHHIKEKLNELETIEQRSVGRGNVRKNEDKITLSLSDCLRYGVTNTKAPGEDQV